MAIPAVSWNFVQLDEEKESNENVRECNMVRILYKRSDKLLQRKKKKKKKLRQKLKKYTHPPIKTQIQTNGLEKQKNMIINNPKPRQLSKAHNANKPKPSLIHEMEC